MKINTFSLLLLFSTLQAFAQESLRIKEETSNAVSNMMGKEFIELTPKSLLQSSDLNNTKVFHINNKFIVSHKGKINLIKKHNMDSTLRDISTDNLKKFLSENDGYVRIQKDDANEFHLESFCRLRGGGILGANFGFYAGKFLVYAIGHGTIAIVAACTGPAAGVTYTALVGTFAAPIEAASNIVAIGTGIATAAATGPV